MTLPRNVVAIRKDAFLACGAQRIDVDESNRHYRSVDGVLYNKVGDKLIRCPAVKESVTIPEQVTSIEKGAFESCGRLTEICLPQSVAKIGSGAFYNCGMLAHIVLPEGLPCIEKKMFYNCSALTSVTILNGAAKIKREAFSGCEQLKDIFIPDSVKEIDSRWRETYPRLQVKLTIHTVAGSYAERFARENKIRCKTDGPSRSASTRP